MSEKPKALEERRLDVIGSILIKSIRVPRDTKYGTCTFERLSSYPPAYTIALEWDECKVKFFIDSSTGDLIGKKIYSPQKIADIDGITDKIINEKTIDDLTIDDLFEDF